MKDVLNEKVAVPVSGGSQPIDVLAAQYLRLKAESEKIARTMEKLREVLEPSLEAQPRMAIQVGEFGKELYLAECESESFDLEKAEKEKGMAKKLGPYVVETRKLDLPSAKKHLDVKELKPFIKRREYFQLRTRVLEDDDES